MWLVEHAGFLGVAGCSAGSYEPIEPEALTCFAVSATKSIHRCSFFCRSGKFTLSVTR